MTAITIKDFSFQYTDKPTLENIDISIAEGEYVAVIGPNGAGKSTLLKCINRIAQGGKGRIEVFGKILSEYSQKELGRLIGYVPQSREQMFPYSVYEFVLMGRYPYLNPLTQVDDQDKQIVDESISLCEIESFRDRPLNSLSGGEKQKVYLAASLAQQPKILLLDEPTAHLDPKYHMEIQEAISQIAKKLEMTVLHVTHDLNYLLYWSQKVIALKEGKTCFIGAPDDLLKDDHLLKTFDTKFFTVEHPELRKQIIVPEVHS